MQLLGDDGVGGAGGHCLQHVEFPRGQLGKDAEWRPGPDPASLPPFLEFI